MIKVIRFFNVNIVVVKTNALKYILIILFFVIMFHILDFKYENKTFTVIVFVF